MELAGKGFALQLAAAASGAAALLAQVVMLRELLAFAQGNELVLGLGLGVWLCCTAGAAQLGNRLAWREHGTLVALYGLLSLAPLFYMAGLAATLLGRPETAGEAASLGRLAATAVLAMAPACLAGGLGYAWVSLASPAGKQSAIYAAETVGAATAGLLFHLVLGTHCHGVWILLLAGAVCAVAAVAVGRARLGRRAWPLPLAVLLVGLGLAPWLAGTVDHAHFPGQHVLALEPSRYGQLAVLDREGQHVFMHDGVLLFTSEDQIAAEESVHLPMLLHAAPRRILMLGGGLGGGLVEALKHAPDRVDYTEMDPALVDLAQRYGGPETRAALADARVHAAIGDGRTLLRGAQSAYDVILIQAPVPQNAIMARYSTLECFAAARRALAPGGILALATPGAETHLDEAARRRHAAIYATLSEVFPFVAVAPGSETLFWAANGPVDARPATLAARLRQRGLVLAQVGPTWLFDRLLPMHVAAYRRALATTVAARSRDFRPVVYFFGLLESLQRLSPSVAKRLRVFRVLASAAPAVAAVAVVGFFVWWHRRERPAPSFAMAAAGAAGMALQLVLLLGHQALRGHLYHTLGLLLAGSMAGLAMGAVAARHVPAAKQRLAWACVGLAAIAMTVALALVAAPRLPGVVGAALLPLLVSAGIATGAVFTSAVEAAGTSRAGPTIYAWDLLGSALAAIVTSVLAIPLLGLVYVAIGCAVMASLAALAGLARA